MGHLKEKPRFCPSFNRAQLGLPISISIVVG